MIFLLKIPTNKPGQWRSSPLIDPLIREKNKYFNKLENGPCLRSSPQLQKFEKSRKLMEIKVLHKHKIFAIPDFFGKASFVWEVTENAKIGLSQNKQIFY